MSDFVRKVQRGEVAQPTQWGFSREQWRNEFNKTNNPSGRDNDLFDAGLWFFDQFEDIRTHLRSADLDEIGRMDLVRMYCGLANHDFVHLSRESRALAEGASRDNMLLTDEMYQQEITTAFGQKINLIDAMEGSVDAVRLPISHTLQSHETENTSIPLDDNAPGDVVYAKVLGETYGIFESLWLECLWNNWKVMHRDQVTLVVSPADSKDQSRAISFNRQARLESEAAIRTGHERNQIPKEWRPPAWVARLKNDSLNDLKFEVAQVEEETDRRFTSEILRVLASEFYLAELFHEPLPNVEELTLVTLLDAWQVLSSITESVYEKIIDAKDLNNRDTASEIDEVNTDDTEDEFLSIKELFEYAPKIPEQELVDNLTSTLPITPSEATSIIDLFTFSSNDGSGLWDAPLIPAGDGRVVPLLLPLLSPRLIKVSQVWAKRGGIQLGTKGEAFEEEARQRTAASIEESSTINDAAVHPSAFVFEVDGKSEEIDLLIRLGPTVLVGEVKCQIIPQVALEVHNHYERLAEGAEQARRKADHLSREPERFMVESDLFEEYQQYAADRIEFFPFVLSNHAIGAGWCSEGTPITDLFVLLRYLDRGEGYHFGTITPSGDDDSLIVEQYYDTEEKAIRRVKDYLSDPPQTKVLEPFLDHELRMIPALKEDEGLGKVQLQVMMDTDALREFASRLRGASTE